MLLYLFEFKITSNNVGNNLYDKIDYEDLYRSDAPTWLKILYLKLLTPPHGVKNASLKSFSNQKTHRMN